MKKFRFALSGVTLAAVVICGEAYGQPPELFGFGVATDRSSTNAAQPAQKDAPIDLTGYWTAVVTEDWRWRMVTAPKGDFDSVPLNPQGRALAMQFNPAAYGINWSGVIDCRAYGAAGLMRMPTRVHITWANPNQLQIDSDWGEQTRAIYFRAADLPHAEASAQGSSLGRWEGPIGPAGGGAFGALQYRGPKLPGGDLAVMTENLAPGWLRRNGVPYGSKTTLIEHYQSFPDATGRTWFDVVTQVNDPEYLAAPYITSSDFLKEPDGSKWSPHPCKKL